MRERERERERESLLGVKTWERTGVKTSRYQGQGPVWLSDISVFKTHNSNPKFITQFSNLTFTQKLQNTCLDSVLTSQLHISITFSQNHRPHHLHYPMLLLLLLASLHLCLSIFSLPSIHNHSSAPSTTTNPPPLTQPLATINHYKPIHHHKSNNHQQNPFINKTQQPSTKPIYQPSTKSKPIHQNKNKTHQQNPSTIDKIKTHSSK